MADVFRRPLIIRTAGFPGSGLKPWHFFRGPSESLERFKRWSVCAPPRSWLPTASPELHCYTSVLSSRLPAAKRTRQVSRAPFPNFGVTFIGEMSTVSSEGVTPQSSFLRPHVPLPLGSPPLQHLT